MYITFYCSGVRNESYGLFCINYQVGMCCAVVVDPGETGKYETRLFSTERFAFMETS